MVKMTGARYLAETLEGYGVTHFFFVPTIISSTLYEMEQHTSIQRIVTHGEKAAVYMADGYARVSGRPGVCGAQVVGAANLAAGLRDPYLACTPMIAITGGPYPNTRNRHTYQQIEDFPLFKPVTKSSALVDSIDRLPDVLRQAFRTATTGTPGPVHIEMTGHQADLEDAEADFDMLVEEKFGKVPPFRPQADAEDVQRVARLLGEAKKPIIVVGGGARQSGASAELLQLAERLQIPVATSLNAKDMFPGAHPLNVGMPGNYSRKSANRAVLEADLVFFIGSRTGSQVTLNWRIPKMGTPVIQLDINPEELGRHYPNTASLLGDAKTVLAQLVEASDSSTAASRSEWGARAKTLVEEWRAEYFELMNSDAEPIRPERICRELSDVIPPDAILVADTGHSGMWTGGMIDLNKPGQSYIRAAGSLGWGLPAALGAKLGAPDRPVILWTGDGGLWYHLTELETAVRWNINTVIMVNNNRALNQEIHPYSKAYGGKLHGRHSELWHFQDINFANIAEEMGATGIRVDKPGELAGAMERAFAADGPVVVDVSTEITAMAPTAFTYD